MPKCWRKVRQWLADRAAQAALQERLEGAEGSLRADLSNALEGLRLKRRKKD